PLSVSPRHRWQRLPFASRHSRSMGRQLLITGVIVSDALAFALELRATASITSERVIDIGGQSGESSARGDRWLINSKANFWKSATAMSFVHAGSARTQITARATRLWPITSTKAPLTGRMSRA